MQCIYKYIDNILPPVLTVIEPDSKDAPTNASEDHHGTLHFHGHPPSTERGEFERIANPSYEPLEMCREKMTYSNL